jgi:hypothetical protein
MVETVRIDPAAHIALAEIARAKHVSLTEALSRAVALYRREVFLEGVASDFAALRADAGAWAEEQSERSAWDATIADPDLLAWAKKRAEQTGVSLSAVFTEAVRGERQMQARRQLLEEYGPDAIPTPEESSAIRAEWEPLRAVAPGKRKATAKRRAKR